MGLNGFVQSASRFADRVAGIFADRLDGLYGFSMLLSCVQWYFTGFVQSADRFADRFTDRLDGLYGFTMLFNGFQQRCTICWQIADGVADRYADNFHDLYGFIMLLNGFQRFVNGSVQSVDRLLTDLLTTHWSPYGVQISPYSQIGANEWTMLVAEGGKVQYNK